MKMQEKMLKQQQVFNGVIFCVDHDIVQIPDGEKAVRDIVHHARDIAVLVINPEHRIVLEKQWREPFWGVTIETPAGKVDARDHHDSRHAALRELNEEVRIKPQKLQHIAIGYNSPGFTDETTDFYVATQIQPVTKELPRDKGEYIHLFSLSLDQALTMIKNGKIKDGKTVMVIWYWKMMEQRRQIQQLKARLDSYKNKE